MYVHTTSKKTKDPLDHSFWICAFCNNQYALDHALGVDGDASLSSFALALTADSCKEVVAVLDGAGTLWQRIWCAFELFFVRILLPRIHNKHLGIAVANEEGVISDGDATTQTLRMAEEIIQRISIGNAQATVAEDKLMIERMMRNNGVNAEDLDRVLQEMIRTGLQLARVRRLAPVVLLTLLPSFAIALVILVQYTWDASPLAKLSRNTGAEMTIIDTAGKISCIILPTSGLGLCCFITRSTSDVAIRQRFRLRAYGFAATFVIPQMVGFILYMFIFANQSQTNWILKNISHLGVASYACKLAVDFLAVFLGLIVGIGYFVARDWPSLELLRHIVEDALGV